MAGSGNGSASASEGGSGGSTTPSYQGGGTPGTFDPKTFGTTLFSDLSRIYQQGPKINPIANYTPYSGQTKGLIDQGIAGAGRTAGELGGTAYGDVGSQNPFYLSGPDYSKGYVGDLASGNLDLGNNYDTGNLARIAGGGGTGNDYKGGILGDVAKGKYLGNGNPYLNKEIARTRNDVSNDVNSTFASNGRFGSDIHAAGLSEGLGNAENTARFNQYNTDYGNMVQALGLQDQSAQRNLGNQLDVLGRQDTARMRDVNGRLQGIGLQQGQAADHRAQYDTEYSRKLGAMDRIDAANAQGLGYSGLLDSKAKELTASNQDMWDRNNNSGYNQIAKYLGLLQGSGDSTNKPVSLWDILGGVGSTIGSIL